MARRTSRAERSSPSPPEPPAVVEVGHRVSVCSHDEWEDEKVLDADLRGQEADHVRMVRCDLRGVALTAAKLSVLSLVDVLAVDCEFSGAYLEQASFTRVELRNCRMDGVVLSGSPLRHVRMIDCKLDGANFRFAKTEYLALEGCSLVEADFHEATLTKTSFEDCDLREINFARASMQGTRLVGSKVDSIQGASSMRGVVVTSDQVLPLALGVFGDLGIEIDDSSE